MATTRTAVSGRRRTVRTVAGQPVTIRSGVVDDAARTAFTHGHCHELALSLHRATGWPTYVLLDDCIDWISLAEDPAVRHAADTGQPVPARYVDELWAHAVVKRPDGRLVDVHGARTPDTVAADREQVADGRAKLDSAQFRQRLVPVPAGLLASLPSTAPASPGVGDLVVDAVLALPDVPAKTWPWQHTLTGYIDTRLADLREDAEDHGAEFLDYVEDLFVDLDDWGLVTEALARRLLVDQVAEAAHRWLRRTYPADND